MNVLNRFKIAPINQKEAKFNIFAPVSKISSKEKYKNEFILFEDNKFLIKGYGVKLTQIHRDILEIILFHGKQIEKDKFAGRIITLWEIQKHLNLNGKNNTWIKNKIGELKRASILMKNKKTNKQIELSIIRAYKLDDELNKYAILFEEIYLQFFEINISLNYKNLLKDILNLKYPITKAVIRYLLTFKTKHQINIDKLLEKVGVNGSKRTKQRERKKLIEELGKVGQKFNIEIKNISNKNDTKNYTIIYSKHPEVKIYYPLENT